MSALTVTATVPDGVPLTLTARLVPEIQPAPPIAPAVMTTAARSPRKGGSVLSDQMVLPLTGS